MQHARIGTIVVCFCALACAGNGTDPDDPPDTTDLPTTNLRGAYLGQTPPGTTPRIFVPVEARSNDTWFWHGALAFLSDGTEFYLDLYYPATTTGIHTRFMRIQDSVWTSIQAPPFAGPSADASPSFTPDGSKVFFISDRPNGSAYGVWTATRSGDSWTQPQPVPIPYDSDLDGGWEVAVTRDETLYLRMHDATSNTDLDIYRTRLIGGAYTTPERLSDEVNSAYMDIGMYVDPDEDYMIFESARPGGLGGTDLYISFTRADGSWTEAVNMGASVNSSANEAAPYVSQDAQYLFFLSNREPQYGRNPYWVDAQVIEGLRPAG